MDDIHDNSNVTASSFCPWYPLARAREHAPRAPGVFQLRVPRGLIAYPRGKSAMIQYEHVADLHDGILAFWARYPGVSWLCRHVEVRDIGAARALHQRLIDRFTLRFGAPPTLPAPADEAGRER